MGCTLGIRIIHLQEDLQPKSATGSANSRKRDRIPVRIQKVSPVRIHDGEDVLNRPSTDIIDKAAECKTVENLPKSSASIDHVMSGTCPPEFHQEDREMLPSIFKAQSKKPPSLQNTRGVTFPSVTFPCSPRKSRSMPLNPATLPGSELESIRMRALRGLIQKQLSDVTDSKRSRLPPICPSKLRKSSSCNDSWLQEIMESDEALPDQRLPVITEVDPTGTESKLFTSVIDSLSVPINRSVSTRSLQTRSSWLNSCSNAKRNAVSIRDRSPMASMENPRLPVILEDLDSSSLGNSPKKFSSKSLDSNAPDTLQSRSLLQVPKMAIPAENSVWLAAPVQKGEIPGTDGNTVYGTTHGYSKTMAEVLGLNDSACVMDSDILENMTFDPSSPLLVNFVSKDSNSNDANAPMDTQNRSNNMQSSGAESQDDRTNGNGFSTMAGQESSRVNEKVIHFVQ